MIDLKEKILKNKQIFLEKNDNYKIFTSELLDFLGEDLMTAPASSMLSLHNAFPGGLVDHILKTTKYAIGLSNLLPAKLSINSTSIVKVCFLHQIGKTFLYKWNESEWHRKNQGKIYEYNEELVSIKIGERSAFYALKYGVELNEEEYQSIVNYDKSDDDKQSKWYGCTLSTILKQANELAIIEEKSLNNG
tara:strand:+ start:2293 stop:2865 length:573 start_codon:yes stop_codon:yes gene_type:complete